MSKEKRGPRSRPKLRRFNDDPGPRPTKRAAPMLKTPSSDSGTQTSGGQMKLFLDTANIAQIREIAAWGVLDGVTTNPTLVAKEGRDFREVINEICSIVDGPISAEVVSTDDAGMIKEAHEYAGWHKNVYVKLPMTTEGLKALSHISKEGIKTNVTLIFQPNQALLAAKAGASIVSPFIGRLDDISQHGMEI